MPTNFAGVDVVPGCHCSVLWLGGVTTNLDVVPLQSGRLLGAIAGRHCSVLWLAGAFFLYIDNTKIGFCYLGSMLV